MRIAIDADGAGYDLKISIVEHLKSKDVEVVDFSPKREDIRDYFVGTPEIIPKVQSGEFDYAILLCGTGMGSAQIANSYKGIRAAVCESILSAKLCRAINNSNVLTMGGFLVAPWLANEMVDVFLSTELTESEGLCSYKDFLIGAQGSIKELEEKIY